MGTKKRVKQKKTVSELTDENKAQKDKLLAKIALQPSANAAAVISEYGKSFGEQDINALIDALILTFDAVNKGDTKQSEAMLMGQAYALQSIFMSFSRRANNQEYLKSVETYLRLALKAQSQCRATLETLATIKNPPVIFAKQANISSGHQQVNNGVPPSHAEINKIPPNELLEAQDGGTTLDTRATDATITENKAMATVE